MQAYEWAQYEDNVDKAFEDAQVAFIMGKNEQSISWVRQLPVSIYLGAFVFQRIHYHGLNQVATVKCPDCGKETKFRFEIDSKILDYDINKMMKSFASVSDSITLHDFMSMSIIDFNSFVNALNDSIR